MNNENQRSEGIAEASLLIRRGRSGEAINILVDIIAGDPNCVWASEELGRAKLFSGDTAGAIADFTLMISRWPEIPKGYTCRADARARAHDLQGAIADYSVAISIDSKHPFAFLQRGRLKAECGDYAGALLDFTVDMDVSRHGRLSGLLNRGKTKYLLRDFSGAIRDLTEAIELEGEKPVFGPLFRGRAKLAAGDISGAIIDFSAAIDAFPGLSNAYRCRAEARALIGDVQGAAADQSRYHFLGGHELSAYL